MKPAVAFIGSEIAAQGFRLAGVRVRTPSQGAELACFQAACGEADVVLMSAQCARKLPQEVLEAAQLGTRPIFMVLPDSGVEPGGATRRARRLLGIEP